MSETSLVAQTVKRLPTMWETQVRFLGWEDPLEKEMASHSSKFLSHLTTPKSARRSIVTFLQSKALVYSPHFYPDKFYKGS